MTERTGTQLITRTCRILRAFSSLRPELSLAEIARSCDLHPATVHRILQALVVEGFLIQDARTTRYRLGYSLVGIGELARQSNDFLKVVRPYAEELERATGEYVAIEVLNPELNVDTLDFIPSTSYRLSEKPIYGLAVAAHCTASGKMLLAYQPQEKVEEYIRRGLAGFTARTITDPQTFKDHLAAVRRQGYAVAESELELGFLSIAAPIFNAQPVPMAAIKVGGPTMRLTPQRVHALAPQVMAAAQAISHVLQRME